MNAGKVIAQGKEHEAVRVVAVKNLDLGPNGLPELVVEIPDGIDATGTVRWYSPSKGDDPTIAELQVTIRRLAALVYNITKI